MQEEVDAYASVPLLPSFRILISLDQVSAARFRVATAHVHMLTRRSTVFLENPPATWAVDRSSYCRG